MPRNYSLVHCLNCAKPFKAFPSDIRRGGGKYCSHACHYAHTKRNITERFWAKVNKNGPLAGDLGPCWLWTASCNARGYGMFGTTREVVVLAHRFAYELQHGLLPSGVMLLHGCDTPACVNPAHLHPGTHRRNMQEMRERGRSLTGDRNISRRRPEVLPRGEGHAHAKLTEADVRTIRALYETGGIGTQQIAARYGISSSHVCGIARRRTWKHVA